MNGRKIFSYIRYFAYIASFIMKFFPNFLTLFLWDLVSIFDNKLFVFIRYCLVRSKAKKCGDNIFIGKNVTIKYMESLDLGDNISIHNNCYIDASGGVTIQDNVSVAHNSTILSSSHTWEDENIAIKYNPPKFLMTRIESNVWMGCGVRIMGGVIVGKNTIIGAGAVCTKSLVGGSVYAGVPAKRIKTI